jgi:hypothetical protein
MAMHFIFITVQVFYPSLSARKWFVKFFSFEGQHGKEHGGNRMAGQSFSVISLTSVLKQMQPIYRKPGSPHCNKRLRQGIKVSDDGPDRQHRSP